MSAEIERRLGNIFKRRAPARALALDPGWLLVLGSAAFIWALVGFKAEPFRRIFIFLLDGVLVTSQ
ncbi:MAG: hypothetical protein U9R11_00020, partial [Chloroflexota bacterium]|nr:hypothetical protein [Chloroflexota bacterium]